MLDLSPELESAVWVQDCSERALSQDGFPEAEPEAGILSTEALREIPGRGRGKDNHDGAPAKV